MWKVFETWSVPDLWSSSGALLATATFTNESASGWQDVAFASPVPVTAGTTYVASYHTNAGHESFDEYYYASQLDAPRHHQPFACVVITPDTK